MTRSSGPGPYRQPVAPRQPAEPPPMPRPPRPKRVRGAALAGPPFSIMAAVGGAVLMAVVALAVFIVTEGGLTRGIRDPQSLLSRALAVMVAMAVAGVVIGYLASRPLRQALASSLLFVLLLAPWPLWWKGGGHVVLVAALVGGVTLSLAFALAAARRREIPPFPRGNRTP